MKAFSSVALLAFLTLAGCSVQRNLNASKSQSDPHVQKLVTSVSTDRLRSTIKTLTTFGTRHTMSDQTSTTQGIGAARQWIFDEMTRLSPRLQVSFETFKLAPQNRLRENVELHNVIAILPGRTPRRIYVTAHYDSRTTDVNDATSPAPGANDDGSGVALTLELARLLATSDIEFDATLVFACWAGEEQALYGSRAHAQKLAADNIVVETDFNNDIIGNTHGGDGSVDAHSVRVYSDGPEDSISRATARYIGRIASIYVPGHRIRLMARQDRFGRSSDHAAFNQAGFPAITFRESSENFARQHSSDDTIDGVDFDYLTQNVRVNMAAAASLAMAPAAPKLISGINQQMIGRQPSGYDANLRWRPVPGAAAYRIYWRDTWSNDWQHWQTVGDVTQFVLPKMSIDDYVFGVAAIGANGQASLISAYVNPTRRDTELRLAQ